jgi:carbamoylphosphate synthase large subunit
VDILARSGEIIALMARRKPVAGRVRISSTSLTEWVDEGPHQILDRQPEVEVMARQLVAHFRLGGLLNIQFRSRAERPERPCVLEINGRMSGGLSYVALTGLNLPALAVKIALLEQGMLLPEIPEPRLPMRVGTRTEAFAVFDTP